MNRYGIAAVVLLAPALIIFGCAKQPATMVTAAPAPTGSAETSPTMSTPASPISPGSTQPMSADQRGGAAASEARPAPSEFTGVPDLIDVHFDFDKYAIRPRDAEILRTNARWFQANPKALILIEGHCDERGTEEYNLALGERRAKATAEYLAGQGIAMSRITTISYGKERPQCTERSEACWAKNRRAHFLIKRG